MDTSNRPDHLDLADDDIRAMSDEEARNALYRMAEKIKVVLDYYESHIETLYAAVTALED